LVVLSAERFLQREIEIHAEVDHAEHRRQVGCGKTRHQTLRHPRFAVNPIAAAREVCEAGNRAVGPNGSVMWIVSSGCFAC
jgi:hypothetical protein